MKILNDVLVRPVSGYPDYWASRDGRIFSTKWGKVRELSQHYTADGYARVKAGNKQLKVHSAVALAWLGEAFGRDVNHINGDKLDNSVANLEWCSRRDNLHHAMRTGLHANPEKPVRGISRATGEVRYYESQAATKRDGFTQSLVNKCVLGQRPHHKNFVWEYA